MTGCDVGGCPFSFFARPPLPGSYRSACFKQSPAPRAEGGAVGCRFAAAGVGSICLLLVVPCRSLAIARSLLSLGSSCGAVLLGVFYSAVSYRYTVQYEQGLCAWLCLTPVAGAAFLSVCGAAFFSRIAYRAAAGSGRWWICSCRSSPRLILPLVRY